MFDTNHYVPILRWKAGERVALREVRAEDRKRITPLIEIPKKIFEENNNDRDLTDGSERLFGKITVQPDPERVLFKAAKAVLESWQYSPFFLDLWHIDGHIPKIQGKKHPLTSIAEECRKLKLSLIPVTGLNRSPDYQSAFLKVAADGREACIRVTTDDVLQSTFSTALLREVKRPALKISDVHLLLDAQDFDSNKPGLEALLKRIPKLDDWRTLTVASGGFPEDLGKLERGRNKIDRHDWLAWKQLVLNPNSLSRKPSFSDYTIQFGRYQEPPDFSNPTASIRYTLPDQWLVMKGEPLRNEDGPKFAQYPASATLLRESEEYYGPEFSYGDMYISRINIDGPTTGTPTTWLQAGINHHLTVVSRQIAGLTSPLEIDVPRRAKSRSWHSQPVQHKSKRGA
jgi:hypothetical protein